MPHYPDEEQLETIRSWPATDYEGLMEYIKLVWAYPDYFEEVSKGCHRLHTGGWSGNEDVIGAIQDNYVFWAMHWYSSRRGGHYEFKRAGFRED